MGNILPLKLRKTLNSECPSTVVFSVLGGACQNLGALMSSSFSCQLQSFQILTGGLCQSNVFPSVLLDAAFAFVAGVGSRSLPAAERDDAGVIWRRSLAFLSPHEYFPHMKTQNLEESDARQLTAEPGLNSVANANGSIHAVTASVKMRRVRVAGALCGEQQAAHNSCAAAPLRGCAAAGRF